ncbi:MAG: hypothetical protein K1Y36_06365 [Blastocatellia bacterium]|nr:hypothetical protein [Blastocatellia bacterium]
MRFHFFFRACGWFLCNSVLCAWLVGVSTSAEIKAPAQRATLEKTGGTRPVPRLKQNPRMTGDTIRYELIDLKIDASGLALETSLTSVLAARIKRVELMVTGATTVKVDGLLDTRVFPPGRCKPDCACRH